MKLLFVLESYQLGGVEKVTLNLVKGLIEHYKDCDIHCVVERDVGELKHEFEQAATCCVLSEKSVFTQYCTAVQPDIVIFTKGGLTRYVNNHLRKMVKKFIAVQHVPIDLPDVSYFRNLVRRIGASLYYRRNVDGVICVSHGIKDNLLSKLRVDKHKFTVIYNPVIDRTVLSTDGGSLQYDDYFVCVGRLHYQKGYDTLTDIIAKVKQTDASVKVVIVGDGPEEASLKSLVKAKGLDENILFHGMTDNPYTIMQGAKAILMTSRWEGLPTVLVEASALHTPIISFDCRYGPYEVTCGGQYGKLIPDGDVMAFRDAIMYVQNGVQLTCPDVEEFTIKASTDNYYRYFQQLLEG